jgi:predicted amidohydrolase YtcJ
VRTLYRRGRVYPGGSAGSGVSAGYPATALLVQDGLIAWLGSEAHADQLGADQVVELDGALITPAFVDAHVHATATGLALTTLDLSSADSLAAALSAVERYARAGRGRPVLASGWDETAWPERRAPTARELDRAGYGGLVYLSRVDAHSAVVSSALLAAVPGASALLGYRADGWVSGPAHDAIRNAALGGLSAGAIRDAQRAARQRASELGIGSMHEMGGPVISSSADFQSLLQLAAAEPGPAVFGYWAEWLAVDTARELGAVGAGGDLFCDGSLGSHTAALHQPYADAADTSGALTYQVDELAEHLVRCHAAGLQAGFHAIGDAAIDQVLDAAELATTRLGGRVAGAGQRIEHAELSTDPARFAASGFIASMQPAFDAAWGGAGGMYSERLGAERALDLNRFAALARAGVELAFGSDAPVTPLAPWAAVRAAVHPHSASNGLSSDAAFAAHTRGGWGAVGRPAGGVLSPGSAATFAVWHALCDESGLPDMSPNAALPICLSTVVDGNVIFDRFR